MHVASSSNTRIDSEDQSYPSQSILPSILDKYVTTYTHLFADAFLNWNHSAKVYVYLFSQKKEI